MLIARSALTIATLAAAALATGPATPAGAAPGSRPNVVVIQTDDQSLDTLASMPHTRALIGDEGVTFDDYHVSFSLCCPSRASLLTGQYAHNTGVLGNVPPNGSVSAFDDTRSLATWLQRAGYVTAHVGKYLNLYNDGIPPGWTEWATSVDPTTYWYYDHVLNDNGTRRTYGSAPEDYVTDVYTQYALDVIDRHANGPRPFFLALDHVAPHTEVARVPRVSPGGPPIAAPRHADRFRDTPLPRTPAFDEADVSDKPAHVQARPRFDETTLAEMTELHRARLRSLAAVDESVRRVVQALRTRGVLDETVVMFLSDNGWMDGAHRYPEGKLRIYEPSTRVPLLVRGPGFARGAVTRWPAMNVDIAPTIAELAGATPDLEVDGRSFAAALRNPALRRSRGLLHEYRAPGALVSQFDGDSGGTPEPDFTAVRRDGWVWVEHASGDRELYDLGRDPHQLDNRATDPALTARREALAAELGRLRDCRGATCGDPSAAPAAVVVEQARRERRRGRPRVRVRLRCTDPVPCSGRLRITAGRSARAARTIARRDLVVPARGTLTVSVAVRRLPRPLRRAVFRLDAGAGSGARRVR